MNQGAIHRSFRSIPPVLILRTVEFHLLNISFHMKRKRNTFIYIFLTDTDGWAEFSIGMYAKTVQSADP